MAAGPLGLTLTTAPLFVAPLEIKRMSVHVVWRGKDRDTSAIVVHAVAILTELV